MILFATSGQGKMVWVGCIFGQSPACGMGLVVRSKRELCPVTRQLFRTRDANAWRFALGHDNPIDSPLGLLSPSVLYWYGETPQGRLPDAGVSLLEVSVAHPEAALLPDLPDKRVIIMPGDPKMSARFDTLKGEVSL